MKLCSVEGCGRAHRCKGLCDKHYAEHRQASPQVRARNNETKKQREQSLTPEAREERRRRAREYATEWRKANPNYDKEHDAKQRREDPEYLEKQKRQSREKRKKNPGIYRLATVKYKYGITLDDIEFMLDAQQGKCAICTVLMEEVNIDHCHATGEVRGLLCRTCNIGLGMFKDKPELLLAATQYLNEPLYRRMKATPWMFDPAGLDDD